MNAASLETSKRLKRLFRFLKDGKEHTTLEIVQGARVCAVNSAVAELRANGVDVACNRQGAVWSYRMALP